jgi:hypothetical protein
VVADLDLVIESAALAAARWSLDGFGLAAARRGSWRRENPLLIRALMWAFGLTSLAPGMAGLAVPDGLRLSLSWRERCC